MNLPVEAPLTAGQRDLWFAHQLEPDGPAYNSGLVLHLHGPLDGEVLEEAVTALVRRHVSLRTRFPDRDGEPIQVVDPAPDSFHVEIVEAADEPRATWLLRGAMSGPFDLGDGPLLRVRLVRMSSSEHFLVLAAHHIITDGFSNEILCRELAALYESIEGGVAPDLPRLPDLASSSGSAVTESASPRDARFWRERLAGVEPLGAFGDRLPPRVRSSEGGGVPIDLPADLVGLVDDLRSRARTTRFTIFLAAFQILLSRLSGKDDFCIGVPTLGRGRPQMSLVGYFVSVVPVRASLAPETTFEELVANVQKSVIEALAHADLPMESILSEAGVERSFGRNPLLQAMFQLEPAPAVVELGGARGELVELPRETATNDLSFELCERPDGTIGGLVEYSSEVLEPITATRLIGQFETLLRSALRDPNAPLSELEALSGEEKALLEDYNQTATPLSASGCIPELCEAQAARTPDWVAVENAEQRLTYRELDAASNQLAHRLRTLGVGPERIVGVCLPRSPRLIVTLLAVLKAGGAYLPLDPAYPDERLASMLEDGCPEVLVTVSGLLDRLPAGEARTVLLDLEAAPIDAEPTTAVEAGIAPANLAVVIYTSGSTGRPNGAAITHEAVLNFALASVAELGLEVPRRVLQFAALSFDAHLEEVYPSLISGGTLVLRDEEMIRTPAAFFAALGEREIDVASVPTAFWHELTAAVERGEASPPACLSLLVIGGERALAASVRAWRSRVDPAIELLNTYGPTETTTNALSVCLSDCEDRLFERAEVISGWPLPNMRAHLLDEDLWPVPLGATGTIFLGGPQLARGYLGRPRLTAERFVPDPLGADGERLYWTGDRGRHAPPLAIEVLGRVDDQVKVRGYRVEPGEIEGALLAHPSVSAAAVVVAEAGEAGRQLIAYCVASDPAPDPAELRAAVARRLPDYMVPAVVTMLDRLPLTPSGKLDRRALPQPLFGSEVAEANYVAPRTSTERGVVEIWEELLGLERIGLDHRFFDLGGHSLSMMRLITRVEQAFGVRVSLGDLHASDTPRALAELVESAIVAEVEAMSDQEVARALAEPDDAGRSHRR